MQWKRPDDLEIKRLRERKYHWGENGETEGDVVFEYMVINSDVEIKRAKIYEKDWEEFKQWN